MSKSFRAFLFICVALYLANLFFGNGLLHLLDPWEADFLRYATGTDEISSLPALIQRQLIDSFGPDTNMLRLSGLGIFLFAIFAFVSLSRPLWGRDTLLAFFLVVAASPILVCLLKLCNPDVWLTSIYLISIPLLLRALKQSDWLWSLGFGLMIMVAGSIHPINALIWTSCWILSLAFLHPDGKKIWNIKFLWPLLILILQYLFFSEGEGWLFHWGKISPALSILVFIGMAIVWMGFLLGGFRDMIWKLRKKEEASILFFCWLIAGLATMSPALGLLFCLLVAKQLQLFFQKKYPWENWIKTGAVITLVFFFLVAMALIYNNYDSFGKGVLGNTLVVVFLFWATAFWSIIGIFSKDRTWIVGGKVFTGLVPFFMAIILLLPYWETNRAWQQKLITKELPRYLDKNDVNWNNTLVLPDSLAKDETVALYAELKNWNVVSTGDQKSVSLKRVGASTDKQFLSESFPLLLPNQEEPPRFYFTQER